MDYRQACVIDAQGYYKEFVQIMAVEDETGQLQDCVPDYVLAEGESLIDAPSPVIRSRAGTEGYIKPKWDGKQWVEAATTEEIAAWEAEHPAPPVTPGTESRLASLELQMTDTQLAVVEAYEQADKQSTDAMMALTELYEMMLLSQQEGV